MIGAYTDQVILMYAVIHAVIPYCDAAYLGNISVSFDD